jgi:hypothetical protein
MGGFHLRLIVADQVDGGYGRGGVMHVLVLAVQVDRGLAIVLDFLAD